MVRAAEGITKTTWVFVIAASVISWLLIVSAVIVGTAYIASVQPEKPKVCRDQFGHRRPQAFCDKRDLDREAAL